MLLTVAIDGPVGAGKSSVADGVAQELGILHLDTGAMYRAFAWQALREGVDTSDAQALCELTKRSLPHVEYSEGRQRTFIGDTDVTDLIRTPEVSMAASSVSKVPGVRAAMVARQQELAAKQSMLLDGRDIGTRVLPNATIKFYLTATPEIRAKRRFDEQQAKGDQTPYEDVLRDVLKRDEQDMTRKADPLRPAQDAQIIDSSYMGREQVIRDLVRRVRMKQGVRPRGEEKCTLMYQAAKVFSAFMFRTLMPITYHGLENLQMDAPYILIGNHKSMMDPLAVAWHCYRYQVRFLGKRELTKNPFARWMFHNMLMIPVDRHNMDMSAIRQCLSTLKNGHVLGIFPEGTRYKEGVMEDLESGVSMIAMMGKVPLLPVLIAPRLRPFHHSHVYVGTPLYLNELMKGGVNKEAGEKVLALITQTYRDMLKRHESLYGR